MKVESKIYFEPDDKLRETLASLNVELCTDVNGTFIKLDELPGSTPELLVGQKMKVVCTIYARSEIAVGLYPNLLLEYSATAIVMADGDHRLIQITDAHSVEDAFQMYNAVHKGLIKPAEDPAVAC